MSVAANLVAFAQVQLLLKPSPLAIVCVPASPFVSSRFTRRADRDRSGSPYERERDDRERDFGGDRDMDDRKRDGERDYDDRGRDFDDRVREDEEPVGREGGGNVGGA